MNLHLKNITKAFGDKEVIKNMDMQVNSGELVSIVGPSGCGKSTTLFMVSGLEKVTSGQVLFENEDVTDLSPDKREIGLVFQNYALYPHLTVYKNVEFPLSVKKIKKEEKDQMIRDIIEAVGLTEYIDKKPGQLSGGQQQRLAIARAIVKRPKVLLLDEPLSNLDAKLKLSTIVEIKNIQRKFNITTLFVTHDQQEAMAISDRMFVMNNGIVQQVGKPNELYRRPKNKFVAEFIGSPKINMNVLDIKDGVALQVPNLINGKINIADGKYYVGLRPEAFYIDETGETFDVDVVDILGRDIQYIGHISGEKVNVIVKNIRSDYEEEVRQVKVKIDVMNVYIFDLETEEVIEHEQV